MIINTKDQKLKLDTEETTDLLNTSNNSSSDAESTETDEDNTLYNPVQEDKDNESGVDAKYVLGTP